MSLHDRGLECNGRNSRDTWSNRQAGLGVQNEAGQRLIEFLPRESTSHSKHPLPTTQEMTLHMDITKMVNTEIRLIIFFAAEDGEALYNQQKQDRG